MARNTTVRVTYPHITSTIKGMNQPIIALNNNNQQVPTKEPLNKLYTTSNLIKHNTWKILQSHKQELSQYIKNNTGNGTSIIRNFIKENNIKYELPNNLDNAYRVKELICSRIWSIINPFTRKYMAYLALEHYSYDTTKIKEINNYINNDLGYKPHKKFKTAELNLIKKEPLLHEPKLKMDLSSVNDLFAKTWTEKIDNNYYLFLKLSCLDEKYTLIFKLPDYIQDRRTYKICLPTLNYIEEYNHDGVLENIIPSFYFSMFEEVNDKSLTGNDNLIGVDLGVVKPFTACIIKNNTVTPGRELTSSFETDGIISKLKRLESELNYTISKRDQYELLLVNNNDSVLLSKWLLLCDQVKNLRSKIKGLRGHSVWLVARDIIDHAIMSNAGIVLEDLSTVSTVKQNSSGFYHGKVQAAILHKSSRIGVRTVKVNAAYSSQTCVNCHVSNSKKDKVVKVNGRFLECSKCGFRIDRDYAASIVIGVRGQVKVNKVKPVTRLSKRDLGLSTPKRPKNKVNKKGIIFNTLSNVNKGFLYSTVYYGANCRAINVFINAQVSNDDMIINLLRQYELMKYKFI